MDSSWLSDFAGADGAPPTTRQLFAALSMLNYDFAYDADRKHVLRYLTDFSQRWGKLSTENLLTIARHFAPDGYISAMKDEEQLEPMTSEEEDTVFALAALDVLHPSATAPVLLPYLTSLRIQERWLAAFGLAALHDERVLPMLGQMLVEFLGPDHPQRSDGTVVDRLEFWRASLPRMLTDWGNPQAVPLLRVALIATVRAREDALHEPYGPEQEFTQRGRRYTGREAWRWYHYERSEWAREEHRLVYALGRLGAFGALVGVPTHPGIYYYWGGPPIQYRIDETGESEVETDPSELNLVPESRRDVFQSALWKVHACCGYLEPQFRDWLKWVHFLIDSPEFAGAMEQLLEGQFGLDEIERRQALADYELSSYLSGTVFEYEMVAESARDGVED